MGAKVNPTFVIRRLFLPALLILAGMTAYAWAKMPPALVQMNCDPKLASGQISPRCQDTYAAQYVPPGVVEVIAIIAIVGGLLWLLSVGLKLRHDWERR